MTVQDAVRTVTVPRQAGPADPPLAPPAPLPPAAAAAPAPATASLLGRDRPLTADERQFAVALVVLESVIVTGLLLAQYAWT